VEEDSYRQSRLCRLLGNPVAFAVVELLANNKELNPSEISRAVGRSVQRVSAVLGALRLAEVVRYDTDGKRNRYRLKHPREVRSVLPSLSRFVEVASVVAHVTASRCFISLDRIRDPSRCFGSGLGGAGEGGHLLHFIHRMERSTTNRIPRCLLIQGREFDELDVSF
jgi:DNA-binding transcriptional ArsR family regulator